MYGFITYLFKKVYLYFIQVAVVSIFFYHKHALEHNNYVIKP